LGEVEEKALTPEEKSIQAQGPYIEEFIDSLNEQASILGEIEQEENYDAPESVINRLNKKLKEERAKLDPKTIKRKD